jgi:hypothetical protein
MKSEKGAIELGDLLLFYGDLHRYRSMADYLLFDHYAKINELDSNELRSMMEMYVTAEKLVEYIKNTFDLEAALLDEKKVKGFKVSPEIMKMFSELIVEFILNKESLNKSFEVH